MVKEALDGRMHAGNPRVAVVAIASALAVFGFSVAEGAVARIGEVEFDTLAEAILNSQAGQVIELVSDVEESFSDEAQKCSSTVTHDLTITSADGVRRTVKATNTKGYSFNVTGGTLTFSNVVLRSASRSTGSYDMYLHAHGSSSKVVFGEDFLMEGITNVGGHAVCYWESGAKLDMKPGAEVRSLYANYGHLRFSGSTFNMSGGLVADCYANQNEGTPVYLYGGSVFNMSGGAITGCKCRNASGCGAVFLHGSHLNTANLSGGAITNNAVPGVYANEPAAGSVKGVVKLSDDFLCRDNARGDILVHRDDEIQLGEAGFTGYVTVTNDTVAGLPVVGTKIGTNTGWYRGACNVRFPGDPDYQLLTANNGDLVWGKAPVRVGGTLYRTMYEAVEAAPDTATFEILHDNPEFGDQIVRTNVHWRIAGTGGQKTLTWPSTDCAFFFTESDVTLADAVLTAVKTISTSTLYPDKVNQYFFNLAGGTVTFESGGGITNVTATKHAILAIAHDVPRMAPHTASPSTLVMKPGSIFAGAYCNYGALRFESANSSFCMEGGEVSGCTSKNGEGSPVYFLNGGYMKMTGGTITGNVCSKDSATVWSNNGGKLTFDFLGGTITGNANPADFKCAGATYT